MTMNCTKRHQPMLAIAKMKKGEVKKHSKDILNWIWVAHYEGYKEGYWTATGNDRFTTDPAKLKERNT